MGREIHYINIKGKLRYAVLSTVTMGYLTPFQTRKETVKWLRKDGYKDDVIKHFLRECYVNYTQDGSLVQMNSSVPVKFPERSRP